MILTKASIRDPFHPFASDFDIDRLNNLDLSDRLMLITTDCDRHKLFPCVDRFGVTNYKASNGY
jgi:hypothetical protein